MEPKYDASSEPYVPTGEDYIGHLEPGDNVKYQNVSDQPCFSTLVEHIKEAPWLDTCKIRILGQEMILESGEDFLTLTETPFQLPTSLDELENDMVGYELTR